MTINGSEVGDKSGPIWMWTDASEIHLHADHPTQTITLRLVSLLSSWDVEIHHSGFQKNGTPLPFVQLFMEPKTVAAEGKPPPSSSAPEGLDPLTLASGSRGQTEIQVTFGVNPLGRIPAEPGEYTSTLRLVGTDGYDVAFKRITVHLTIPERRRLSSQPSSSRRLN